MMGLLANMSPKVIGGLLITLVLSVSACGVTGYMLMKSHEKRGELAQALENQQLETERVNRIANDNARALKAERMAWEISTELYTDELNKADKAATRLREDLRNAPNRTNDVLPDSVIDRLPK